MPKLVKDNQLDEDFEEFIVKRCQEASIENNEYMDKEYNKEADQDELQAIAETLCYEKGFHDALLMLNIR